MSYVGPEAQSRQGSLSEEDKNIKIFAILVRAQPMRDKRSVRRPPLRAEESISNEPAQNLIKELCRRSSCESWVPSVPDCGAIMKYLAHKAATVTFNALQQLSWPHLCGEDT